LPAVAASGAAAAVVSIPSVFVSAPLVHLAALVGPVRRAGWRDGWVGRLAIAAMYDLALLAIYAFWLAPRSNATLTQIWRGDFLPTSSLADAWGFLATNGRAAVVDALPAGWGVLAPLAAVGLLALCASRPWRAFGLFIVLAEVAVLMASALQRYPIGAEFRGRTIIFSYAITITLVVAGLHAITRWLPARPAVDALAAAAALVLTVAAPVRVAYFPLDHVSLVDELEARAGSADAVVLNTSAAYLAGYYTDWAIHAVPDDSPQGFGIEIDRPHTITLPRGAEEGARDLGRLETLLARDRPMRAFFFSTRRGIEPVERFFKSRGYTEVRRTTSTVSTFLIEYARTGG
jgi:hypothetical protein